MSYICQQKIRDNNGNITDYIIAEVQNNQVISQRQIKSKDLKLLILNKQVTVDNLKLTVDNKLIDKTDEEIKEQENKRNVQNNTINKLNQEYKPRNKAESNKLKYIGSKFNSKRVGKSIVRALLIGIAVSSIATAAVGCGATKNISAQDIAIESTTAWDELENATLIEIDMFSRLGQDADVKVNNKTVAQIYVRNTMFTYKIDLKSTDGTTKVSEEESANLFKESWSINDEDGNTKFRMTEKKISLVDEFNIEDANGKQVLKLKSRIFDTNLITETLATLYDSEGNKIAEISNPKRSTSDYTIKVNDNDIIDNSSIIMIANAYIRGVLDLKQMDESDAKKEAMDIKDDMNVRLY